MPARECDVVVLSAGFDRNEADWGRLLKAEDYALNGEKIKAFAGQTCRRKVFGVLEGGYNHGVLGKNVKALLTGLA